MADIAMCKGGSCKLKETCYRFNAKYNEFGQSYFSEPPMTNDEECDYYWVK